MLEYKKIKTPVGEMVLVASDKAIVMFGWKKYFQKEKELLKQTSKDSIIQEATDHPVIARAEKQLNEYFRGQRKAFDLPLAPEGTEFQKAAWRELSKIPFGGTISYGEQAKRMGKPAAIRAVGGANGKNPIAIIVPCHRVIGANGSLTGFGGGMKAKKYLLELEK